MRRFLLLRGSTLLWGFVWAYVFTGSLITSVQMWVIVAGGNTVFMYLWGRS